MKKLVSIFLIVTMLLTMFVFAVPAGAAENGVGDVEEGYVPGGWAISTEEELKNMVSGTSYYLENDITVTDPIFTDKFFNNMTLDGNGHTITYTGSNGLFGWGQNSAIKNLKVVGTINATNGGNIGVLSNGLDQSVTIENVLCDVDINIQSNCGHVGAVLAKVQNGGLLTMKNVVNKGTITVEAGKTVNALGGLVGLFQNGDTRELNIENCVNDGDIIVNGSASRVGGIVGYVNKNDSNKLNAQFINCVNNGDITLAKSCHVGGISADTNAKMTITGCTNNGDITTPEGGTQPAAGGILSLVYMNSIEIKDCVNTGTITASNTNPGSHPHAGFGGILGAVDNRSSQNATVFVSGCWNKGDIKIRNASYSTQAGGIIGRMLATPHVEITNSINSGDIKAVAMEGWSGSGGILGCFLSIGGWDNITSASYTVKNCHNYGNLLGMHAGGVIAASFQMGADIDVTVENCTNSGTVNADRWAGGIVGPLAIEDSGYTGTMDAISIKNSVNYGYITAEWEAAGIAVRISPTTKSGTITIDSCANAGTIVGRSDNSHKAAGIIRQSTPALTITNCVNVGEAGSTNRYPIAPAAGTAGISANITAEDNVYAAVENNDVAGANGILVDADEAAEALVAIEDEAYSTVTEGGRYIFSEAQFINAPKTDVELYLFRDITLTEANNLGAKNNLVNSKFYGQGNTITLDGAYSVFWWTNNVEISDLTIEGEIIADGSEHAAPLAPHGNSGDIVLKNITSNVDIEYASSADDKYVAGVIGKVNTVDGKASFTRVNYNGTITYDGDVKAAVGGITAEAVGNVNFYDCEVKGEINVDSTDFVPGVNGIGGIVGVANGKTRIASCDNYADINVYGRLNVGGIVGNAVAVDLYLDNVNNYGSVTLRSFDHSSHIGIGGVIGATNNSNNVNKVVSVINTANFGDVALINNAKDIHVGGIIGRAYALPALSVHSVLNAGDVANRATTASWACVGGVVGGVMTYIAPGEQWSNGLVGGLITITDAINLGDVENTSGNVAGGILGGTKQLRAGVSITVERSTNYGNITANNYAGGVVGSAGADDVKPGFYKFNVVDCVNTGSIYSTNSPDGGWVRCAGGIVGFIAETKSAATEKSLISGCVNTGSVKIGYAPRNTDAWGVAAGIVGTVGNYTTITNCVNAGELYSKNDGKNGTWAIVNSYEDPFGNFYDLSYIDAADKGNIYLEGTSVVNASREKFATAVNSTTLNAAVDTLGVSLDTLDILEAYIAKSEAQVEKTAYTTLSWNEYQTALNAAKTIAATGSATRTQVSEAIYNLICAQNALVFGGAIYTAEDFANMDDKFGDFVLMNDIYVDEPIEFMHANLNGNGYTIYTTCTLFDKVYDATIENLNIEAMIETGSIINDVLSDTEMNEVSIAAILGEGSVVGYLTENATLTLNDGVILAMSNDSAIIIGEGYGNLDMHNVVVLGTAYNAIAGLVGGELSSVVIDGAIIMTEVYNEEDVAIGMIEAAQEININGVYYQGYVDSLGDEYVFTAQEENVTIENVYALVYNFDYELLAGSDVDSVLSGKAAYAVNEAFGEDILFQIIGLEATPYFGEAYSDGSNVVIFDGETYKNVGTNYQIGTPPAIVLPKPNAPVITTTTLEDLILKVNQLVEKDYTAESWEDLELALELAELALESDDQSDINQAIIILNIAIARLRKVVPATSAAPDLTDIKASIAAAEALNSADFTVESWAKLQAVLTLAKASLENGSAASIASLKTSLDAAISALVKYTAPAVTVDYSKLNAAITSAEALNKDDYSEATWATAQAMLAMAKAATTSGDQAAVDQAEKALTSAVAGLEAPVAEPVVEEKGCGASIVATAAVMVTVLGLGVTVLKKKED